MGAKEISHMMFNAPDVNFALISPVAYRGHSLYCVSVRVVSTDLHQLWQWLLSSSRETLLGHGLIALVLRSGTFLWLRGRPELQDGEQTTPYSYKPLVYLIVCTTVTSLHDTTVL